MNEIRFPVKTGEYENRFFDSTIWNDFVYRDDDVVIASYAKAGTTLVQQIVAQLIFNGKEDVEISKISPWLDSVYPDKATKLNLVESQTHRRFLKTHLPVGSLVFSPRAKYIYICRDGRDIVWSLYDHQSALRQETQTELNANGEKPGRLRVMAPPQALIVDYFTDWLNQDGHPFWPFWEGIRSWWSIRHLPNVLIVHFANLIEDMPGEIRRIAKFLDTPIDESQWEAIIRHCSFDYMKTHAARYVPLGTGLWKEGGKAFFSKGKNARWQDVLPTELSEQYQRRAVKELGEDCARWLATGKSR
ncbi:sulfotransferase domain-containing protein [Brenneria sp. g21c3]|uniref:sulfotransferase domain-containing protein n=1 Tax=Brenneria sp. g21c3 TaxID=3093893 RepID=UPI002EC31921|nr:sulfotransferase domain-containing protein [Brenneria sp. g21c3]